MEAATETRYASLSAKVFDASGNVVRDLGVISEGPVILQPALRKLPFRYIWKALLFAAATAFVCAAIWGGIHVYTGVVLLLFSLVSFLVFGLVTNVGVAFEAATFAGGTSTSVFNNHDSGTGTTAASVTDTALQTPTGVARVAGVQSTPGSTNVYQTVATITYNGTFAVTEWGLFSALTSGTLWDHRVFSAINVVNTNSIQFTYALTIPSGGS